MLKLSHMKTNTAQNLLDYIEVRGQVTAKELANYLNISPQALFRHLRKFLENGKLSKIGRPPKVFYQIKLKKILQSQAQIDPAERGVINQNYLLITPAGERLEGLEGFVYWCGKNKLDVAKTAPQYVATLEKFNRYKKHGLVDGLPKLKSTFEEVFLDKLFYLDFYSIERFGKTKLGQLLLYAKQSQNKQLIKELAVEVKPKIESVVKKYHIEAIGFIPPTVKREVQFMKELQNNLHPAVPVIGLTKARTAISVPQKSLGRLEDRVENAAATIFLEQKGSFKNILLIDDAVGSGATLNETAKKIKHQKICTGQLFGLAITGSFKGFDIISEV